MSDRYIGSNFDDFLQEEGLLLEVKEAAIERSVLQNSREQTQQSEWLSQDEVRDEWEEE